MVRMWLPEPPTDSPLDEVQPLDDIVIPGTDTSDTEDEENQYDGYVPLPLLPTENENEQSSEDEYEEGNENSIIDRNSGGYFPEIEPIHRTLVQEVWSGPPPEHVDIEMDSAKANEVKLAMANFTLPSSSIPDWAANIPEEQWKEQLINRIQSLQENKIKK